MSSPQSLQVVSDSAKDQRDNLCRTNRNIVDKLNELIKGSGAFTHEKDAVYFLVQLRKLMEHDGILAETKVQGSTATGSYTL